MYHCSSQIACCCAWVKSILLIGSLLGNRVCTSKGWCTPHCQAQWVNYLHGYQPQYSFAPVTSCHPWGMHHSGPPSLSLRSAVGSYRVSHSVHLYPNNFTCKCLLKWLISLFQGLWNLLQQQYQIFKETSIRYPSVAQSHGNTVIMLLRTSPFMGSSNS